MITARTGTGAYLSDHDDPGKPDRFAGAARFPAMSEQAYAYPDAPRRTPTSAELADIREQVMRVRRFSDGLFRVGPVKIGADGLIGFIPGAGDLYAVGAGGYLLHLAWKAGAPRSVLGKMAGWLALDLATGAVPLAGDAVDFFFRGHAKAAHELERWLDRVHPEGRRPAEPRWRGWFKRQGGR
jgi:hypothetical protein